MSGNLRRITGVLLPSAIVCLLTVFLCLFLFRFDNKYESSGPQGIGGELSLNEYSLADYPTVFLVNGWEFYNGRLLSPADFFDDPPKPDEYIFIGQYGGFEAGNLTASPHGSASYRLRISLPREDGVYLLELPEIYSAYRLYINGVEQAGLGDPHPGSYLPVTGNRFVTFGASGQAEVLIAVSDFSHMYSGMVYPPAFGAPDATSLLLSGRLSFRVALCAAAGSVGLIALLIGLLSRKKALAALYGLICLCFVGYVSYPVVRTFIHGFYPFYTIENFSFCAMFVAVMLLQCRVCGVKSTFKNPFILFGAFMCLVSVAIPFAARSGNLPAMVAYSNLIAAYKWLTAGFLTYNAVRAAFRNTVYSGALLYGAFVFDCALIMDRILPLYEPIVTGWFSELAGFVLVLCIGVVVGKDVAAEYAKSAAMEERAESMERLSGVQRAWYPLLQKRVEEAKTAQHDLRHHFIAINGFLERGQYDRLKEYVAASSALPSLSSQSSPSALSSPLSSSALSTPLSSPHENELAGFCEHDVVNILAYHYSHLAGMNGVDLEFALDIGDNISVADADLCGLMSNLLENAMEACLRQKDKNRFIRLSMAQTASSLMIFMENSGGAAKRSASGFISAKPAKSGIRKGYGLDSVRAVAVRYAGAAEFSCDDLTGIFTSTVMLSVAPYSKTALPEQME